MKKRLPDGKRRPLYPMPWKIVSGEFLSLPLWHEVRDVANNTVVLTPSLEVAMEIVSDAGLFQIYKED